MGPGNNSAKDWRIFVSDNLSVLYAEAERQSIVNMLFESLFSMKPIDLIRDPNRRISESEILQLNKSLKRLKSKEPVQYVLGSTSFYNCDILCDPRALIPRPETEEMVDTIVKDLGVDFEGSIIDLGTGTGCIPIALAKALSKAQICATDISESALELADENAKRNQVELKFVRDDFSQSKLDEHFDVIVSNPPYVLLSEAAEMEERVKEFEPHLALFSPEDNDLFSYEHILKFSKRNLAPNGCIYLELNADTAERVLQMYLKEYPNAHFLNDLSGKQRYLKV